MSAVRFGGGGSLDGLALELPAVATAVVTTERDGSQSHYVVDDTTRTAWFSGFNDQGREMTEIMRYHREDDDAAAAASRPRGCRSCGKLLIGSAYDVHFEAGPGSRCLDGDARGQLEQVDGAWVLVGSGAAGW